MSSTATGPGSVPAITVPVTGLCLDRALSGPARIVRTGVGERGSQSIASSSRLSQSPQYQCALIVQEDNDDS